LLQQIDPNYHPDTPVSVFLDLHVCWLRQPYGPSPWRLPGR
jgi:hypothetical protein